MANENKIAIDVKKVRKDFPILKTKVNNHNLIYFDNAATTQKPESVIEAESNYYRTINSNVHRGVHQLSQLATKEYDNAHSNIADFIGAKSNEIVFTSGTTESINQIAFMLIDYLKNQKQMDLSKCNIVTTEMEHHSNFLIWQKMCEKFNIEFRVIPMNKEYNIDLENAYKLIDENTIIVACSHMSNLTGSILPIKELSKVAKEKNKESIIIVDGAQYVAHSKVDVKELDIDFYAFSGHKLYGPTGIGFYYAKSNVLEKLTPHFLGGGIVNDVSIDSHELIKNNLKFECGTPKIAQAFSMVEAINYLNKLDMNSIENYELELTQHLINELKKVDSIRIIGPEQIFNENNQLIRGSLVSFVVEGVDAFDIGEYLNQFGIAIRIGMHCAQPLLKKINITGTLRVSLSFYNTKEEIDFFITKLKKGMELFKKWTH